MRNYSLILLILCNVLLFSCKDTDKQVLNHLVKTWLGKHYKFTTLSLLFKLSGN